MKKTAITILLLFVTVTSSYAQSNNLLGDCMARETTGADREHFAEWIFSIMAEHPVAESYADISRERREHIDERTAVLVTRLVVEDCNNEARLAYEMNGEQAVMDAFRLMGEVAVQELFRNEAVNRRSENWAKYLDEDEFETIFD